MKSTGFIKQTTKREPKKEENKANKVKKEKTTLMTKEEFLSEIGGDDQFGQEAEVQMVELVKVLGQ